MRSTVNAGFLNMSFMCVCIMFSKNALRYILTLNLYNPLFILISRLQRLLSVYALIGTYIVVFMDPYIIPVL